MIYMLEHQYTENSLDYRKLKNGDLALLKSLRIANEEGWFGSENHYLHMNLALVNYHTSHEIGYYVDTEVDSEFTITPIQNVDDSPLLSKFDYLERDFNLYKIFPIDYFETEKPDKVEEEEYHGNYGATRDKWYKRAALILWIEEKSKSGGGKRKLDEGEDEGEEEEEEEENDDNEKASSNTRTTSGSNKRQKK